MFGDHSVISVPRSTPLQHIELAKAYVEAASKAQDSEIALRLCHDAEVTLSHVKKPRGAEDPNLRDGVATTFVELGKVLDKLNHQAEARTFREKAELRAQGPSTRPSSGTSRDSTDGASSRSAMEKKIRGVATISSHVFTEVVRVPPAPFKLPELNKRLDNTPQLACCLALLQDPSSLNIEQDSDIYRWLVAVKQDGDEHDRLKVLAKDVIRAFKRDELKDSKAVTEAVYLAPVLEKEDFRFLLNEFTTDIKQKVLLDVRQLEGLAQLLQGADRGSLNADDLVKILELFKERLVNTFRTVDHKIQLTIAISRVLDAMADTEVAGLDRKTLHAPLTEYLEGLKGSSDPFLVYQAAYSYQALLCVPDNESNWQAFQRRSGKIIQGVTGLVAAVKGLDFERLVESLDNLQKGLEGVSKVVGVVVSTYKDVAELINSGNDFLSCLQDGLSFDRKQAWYPALRGADTLIQEGNLGEFKRLVCEAPCRFEPAFQWGICLRLGEIAVNSTWNTHTRDTAVEFLGEIYRNDEEWGRQPSVKQWILNILMQLSSYHNSQPAKILLEELESDGVLKKQELYQTCLKAGPTAHPLMADVIPLASPSLLDLAQKKPDVESGLRQLRMQRMKDRSAAVYIPPQAKASVQAPDTERFPLMKTVMTFLETDQKKVFLVQGDSGGGKSTFNQELEFKLWESYVKTTGDIPLHISLPAIDKPEHDMVAKQLRKAEFEDAQIRELKSTRRFVLICDGYDESQQTENLYNSNRLNQPGEWQAKMVISCRSEYLGSDYRDRFQPGGRNALADPGQFQEAFITKFSLDEVQDYIKQYVSENQTRWRTEDYQEALRLIPSLRDLVRNPFMMSLSLEVLPRMVDPGQSLSTALVTRVSLYDQFIELWLERGKKRLREKKLTGAMRAAFENLSDEGFTKNGIHYLKTLAAAIFKEQGGHSVVEYSRLEDQGTWKDDFFGREEDKQLLREACPLKRSGNQHRFIHRSLLEYGMARAVFDPQDAKKRKVLPSVASRRGSTSSIYSFEMHDTPVLMEAVAKLEPDFNSPLAGRYFVNEPSVLEFLKERVQQEPLFKQQLLAYVELSKTDVKWRTAAANAMSILVRAGVQFNSADLRGIQIPRADLSFGMFDSALLQGADLRKANLCNVWLRQADLTEAHMAGVNFGELPSLLEEGSLYSCAYSPDNKSFVVGLSSGAISVYTTSSWEKLRQLDGHTDEVTCVVYSRKGNHIVSGGSDKSVRLWDVESGICRHVFTDHTRGVTSVAYSSQEDLIASGSSDGMIKLWNVEERTCRRTLYAQKVEVTSVAFSPQGDQIAAGCSDKTVRLWDVQSGAAGRIFRGHGGQVSSVVYSPQGDLLASGSWDMTVRLWDLKSDSRHKTLTGHTNRVTSVAYSPKGDQIASGSHDMTVRLWDVETAVCHQPLTGHDQQVSAVAYSPNGDQVASGSSDKTVRLWSVRAETPPHAANGHSDGVISVEFSPEGGQIASRGLDGTVRLWDVETGACCLTLSDQNRTLSDQNRTVRSVAFSSQGLIACSWDKTVQLWDKDSGVILRTLTGHSDGINSTAFSPTGDVIASTSGDKTVRLWSVESGDCLKILSGHEGWVSNVAYSPKGGQIASGSYDKTVRLWDVGSGDCFRVLSGHTEKITVLVYSPNGNQIASGSLDTTVRVWDTETGECRSTLAGHSGEILCVIYSPNGDQIVSSSKDHYVKVWSAETGSLLHTLEGHEGPVSSVVYSPIGDLIASGSEDTTVRLWDIASGQCRGVIRDFHGPVHSIAWSTVSDVTYLATGCGDKSVRLWQVTEEEGLNRVCLRWSSTNDALAMTDGSIEGVRGLSYANKLLLKQRKAIGEPALRLRNMAHRVMRVMSIVGTFGQPPNPSVGSS